MESGEAADVERGALDCHTTTRNRRNSVDAREPTTTSTVPLRTARWVCLQERGSYELCRERNCSGKLGYYTNEPETIRCDINPEHVYSWG